MRALVITINSNERSVDAAERCIESAREFGIRVERHSAIVPETVEEYSARHHIPAELFVDRYSRPDRARSAFCSHHSLWDLARKTDTEILVLEHDAVFDGPVPRVPYRGLLSLGAPSYGRFETPRTFGVNPLTSKTYLPGAHAYLVRPEAARVLMESALTEARAVDVYLNRFSFPWIEEFYPWPVRAVDKFTTIQMERGCRAKHGWNDEYDII